MLPISILAATLAGGVLSVLLAAGIGLTWLRPLAERLLAYAAGLLLGFALIGLLPEALDLGLAAVTQGQVLIAAAFLVDTALGWGTAVAVLSHEVPHGVVTYKSVVL